VIIGGSGEQDDDGGVISSSTYNSDGIIVAIQSSTGPVVGAISAIGDFLQSTDTTTPVGMGQGDIQSAFELFQSSIASSSVMGLFDYLIPPSTETWRLCFFSSAAFDGGFFEGAWTGQDEWCFDDFPGWETLVNVVKFFFALCAFLWGIVYIWGGY